MTLLATACQHQSLLELVLTLTRLCCAVSWWLNLLLLKVYAGFMSQGWSSVAWLEQKHPHEPGWSRLDIPALLQGKQRHFRAQI